MNQVLGLVRDLSLSWFARIWELGLTSGYVRWFWGEVRISRGLGVSRIVLFASEGIDHLKLTQEQQLLIRKSRLARKLTQAEAGRRAWAGRSETSAREGWTHLENRIGLSISDDALTSALHVVGLELLQEVRPRAA